jgi:hypothetical protein
MKISFEKAHWLTRAVAVGASCLVIGGVAHAKATSNPAARPVIEQPSELKIPPPTKTNFPSKAQPPLCSSWADAVEAGRVDEKVLPEASGLAVSRDYDRLYFINDSGDGPHIYATDRRGQGVKTITIKGVKPLDAEAIALSDCPGSNKKCLVYADIGDNLGKRKHVQVALIEEPATVPAKVAPVFLAKIRYPDRPHNAEAIAVFPGGVLYVMTKESYGQPRGPKPTQIYRTTLDELAKRAKSGRTTVLESVGRLDVPSLLGDAGESFGGLLTDACASADGERLLLLTYSKAIEFRVDPKSKGLFPQRALAAQQDYSIVNLTKLEQMESIAYDRNDRDHFYSTEKSALVRSLFGGKAGTPVMSMRCQ